MNFKKIGSLGLLACYLCQVLAMPIYLWLAFQNESNWYTSSLSEIDNPEVLDLKIPMAVPYAGNWDKPQESEGLIEYQGDFYTLVNIQLQNDTLNARYIKNTNAREIFGMLAEKASVENPNKEQAPSQGKNFSKWLAEKYISNQKKWGFEQDLNTKKELVSFAPYFDLYQSTDHALTLPPPKHA